MKKLLLYIILILSNIGVYAATDNMIIPNKGQWADSIVAFYSQPNLNVWITKNAIYFDKFSALKEISKNDQIDKVENLKLIESGKVIRYSLVESEFNGLSIDQDTSCYFNYFIGSDKSKYASKVYKSNTIRINDIYPGIDIRFYLDNSNLRYDYIVKPNANPENIRFSIDGADNFNVDNTEIAFVDNNNIIKTKDLLTYQILGNERVKINSRFVRNGNIIKFEIGSYDKSSELVIDPVIYSTFIGGSNFDESEVIAKDTALNIYMCGYTSSADFPTTIGAYSTENKSAQFNYPSCFFSKFDSLGNLKFSTFFGGYWDDYAKDFQIDSHGDFVITGYTASITTFPTTKNAYDTLGNGGYDAFITKLSSAGDSLLYSTYIGGSKDDYAIGIALDNRNNPHIIGYTTNTGNYPVTQNAVQTVNGGKYDVFVTKMDSIGKNLIYSTYLGGANNDFGQDIAVDAYGYAYATGYTRSANFPVTFNAYNRVYQDTVTEEERGDVFISKISTDGQTLIYSTYFGGKSRDGAYSILLDSLNNVYLTGYTESPDFPVTANAFDKIYSKNDIVSSKGDVFCFKLNTYSNNLMFSTFLGGSATDRAWSMCFDDSLNIFITGTSSSIDFPVTKNCVDSVINDIDYGSDAFVSKLSADGSRLTYSTLLGGSKPDVGKSILHYRDTTYCISGITSSADFPITKNAYDTLLNSSNMQDIFYSIIRITPYYDKLHFDIDTDSQFGIHHAEMCKGDSIAVRVNYTGGVGTITVSWNPTNGISNPSGANVIIKPDTTTKYTVTITDLLGNIFTDTLLVEILSPPIVKIDGPKTVMRNTLHNYSVPFENGNSYSWKVIGGSIVSGQNTNSISVQWYDSTNNSVSVIAANKYGCGSNSGDINIRVGDYFYVELNYSDTPNMLICKGDTLFVKPLDDYAKYLWSDGSTGLILPITKAGIYWLIVEDSNGFIGYSDTLYVTEVDKPAKPKIKNNNGTLQCTVIAYGYQWYLNGNRVIGAVSKSFTPTEFGSFQVEIYDTHGCKNISDILYYSDVDELDYDLKVKHSYDNISQILTIQIDNPNVTNNCKIKIVDILGNIVCSDESTNDYISFDLSNLSNGLYLLEISYFNKVYNYKINKN